jgi:hypothetical protein
MERLICPNTADQCAFAGYCIVQKSISDSGGPNPGSSLDTIHGSMANEAVAVMSSFCAEERIVALDGLAATSTDEDIRTSAAKRSKQIAVSESFFSNGINSHDADLISRFP